jgi:hypothetical protein
MFNYLLKIKTFGHVIKYFNTLSHYDIVLDVHLYRLSYACELDISAYMRCIRFLSKTGCDIYRFVRPQLRELNHSLAILLRFSLFLAYVLQFAGQN